MKKITYYNRPLPDPGHYFARPKSMTTHIPHDEVKIVGDVDSDTLLKLDADAREREAEGIEQSIAQAEAEQA